MHMLRLHFRAHLMAARGITDLKYALQNIFAENIVEKKEDFLQTFSTKCDYVKSIVSKGEILQQNTTNAHNSDSNSYLKTDCSDLEVIRVVAGTMPVGHLYSRLLPLVLNLVDGSNPIDITDPRCEILLIVQKKIDLQGGNQLRLLGFAAIYRFYHYPDSLRLRLSQILVLPPYQRKGYSRHLLEVVFPNQNPSMLLKMMYMCLKPRVRSINTNQKFKMTRMEQSHFQCRSNEEGCVQLIKNAVGRLCASVQAMLEMPGAKQHRRKCPIWFSLVASEYQGGDVPLPQISACYLRIKFC